MKEPIVLRRKDTLQPVEAAYWKDLLYRVIKIGTELEVAPPKGCDRPTFEASVRQALQPSCSLDMLGANGVLDVTPEHCGIEIRIIGRQPHFRALQTSICFDHGCPQGARSPPRGTRAGCISIC